jgi:hypothetical protein
MNEILTIDKPWLVNGFKGIWNFSDHDLIPSLLRNFIMDSFNIRSKIIVKFKEIPLEEINTLMNNVWDGPGSLVEIYKKENVGWNPKL